MKKGRTNLSSKLANDEEKFAYLAVTPTLIVLFTLMAIPIIRVMYHSMTWWNGTQSKFIGFTNFIELFRNQDFWFIMGNTLIYLIAVPLVVLFSLCIAFLIYEEVPGSRFFRAIFFIPYVLSSVVVGFLFRSLFAYSGPVNEMLMSIGLDMLAIDWLGTRGSAIFVIILVVIWTQFGYGMLVNLAAMSSITPSVFEAAKLDGANWWQRLCYVVLPMMTRTIEFLVIINSIFVFNSLFDYIFTITRGGPGYDTTPISYWIYTKAFRGNDMGVACALAMILFAIVIVVSCIQRHVANKVDDWSE